VAQVVSRRPLAAEARVGGQASPYGGQSGTGTGFSPSSSVAPVDIIPPWLSILVCDVGMSCTPVRGPFRRHDVSPRRQEHVCVPANMLSENANNISGPVHVWTSATFLNKLH
jgi:hypothetical protein